MRAQENFRRFSRFTQKKTFPALGRGRDSRCERPLQNVYGLVKAPADGRETCSGPMFALYAFRNVAIDVTVVAEPPGSDIEQKLTADFGLRRHKKYRARVNLVIAWRNRRCLIKYSSFTNRPSATKATTAMIVCRELPERGWPFGGRAKLLLRNDRRDQLKVSAVPKNPRVVETKNRGTREQKPQRPPTTAGPTRPNRVAARPQQIKMRRPAQQSLWSTFFA